MNPTTRQQIADLAAAELKALRAGKVGLIAELQDIVARKATYATDLDGNVMSNTCSGTTTTFAWNAEGQLDSLRVGARSWVKFKYDALGSLSEPEA